MNRNESDELTGPLGNLNVPALDATEIERIVGAAMPQSSSSWSGWWSHAAAVIAGISLMAAGRGCQSGGGSTREVIVEVPVVEFVERIVQVPIEVPVEVPVEVRVSVPYETVVERIVYRDRPVTHALPPRVDQAADAELDAAAASTPGELASSTPKPTVADKKKKAARSRASQRAHLEVRRVGSRVTLRTRGLLTEIVPVLIDTLESTDGAVVLAALDRLQSIHADLGARAVDLRPEVTPPRRRSGIRALLSARAPSIRASELDDAALWRGWWARQQASDDDQRRAGSI